LTARILVTRPEPGNEQTAKRLAQAGFEPILLPLTKIESCNGQDLTVEPGTEAIALTSPNGLRFAPESILSKFSDLPVYAVGAASARFAQDCGLQVAGVGDGGALELAALIAKKLKVGTRIAYPCGKVRRPDFETSLRNHGFRIAALETYYTNQVSYSTEIVNQEIGDIPIDAVFLHSAKSGQAADSLLRRGAIPQITEKTWFFCFSERIADSLISVRRDRIMVVAAPTDIEMIAAAKRIFD
jgi:uroporphyrinogen-III synthase